MSPICPFIHLIPQLSIAPLTSGGLRDDTRSNSGALSPPLMTPSFAPNTSPDYLEAADVTVPNLIAAHMHHHAASAPGAKVSADDMDLPEGLDLALPISELLKIGTQRAHADAEHSEGAKELMRGTLGLEEYIRWNVILWRVYE